MMCLSYILMSLCYVFNTYVMLNYDINTLYYDVITTCHYIMILCYDILTLHFDVIDFCY